MNMRGPSPTTRTTCPYCGVGCGLLVTTRADGGFGLTGDPDHPSNQGRLCAKGAALGETLGLAGRLLHPEVDGVRVPWDEALTATAARIAAIIKGHGPKSVAFYVSGQLLTEDYYVANKLLKGFIGSANIDSNSRLCMASSVAGHLRSFGEDLVPGNYEDLEEALHVVLVGSNMAWCHPVLHQRLTAAKEARSGLRVTVIDPRRTATAEGADQHLALAPGTDHILFAGLLTWLKNYGHLDFDFLEGRVEGYAKALAAAATLAPSVPAVAARCRLPIEAVLEFFRAFARTERVVTLWSQGVNQSVIGTDTVNAIINCHLATGRISRPGMGPFSITGQPNAMGGREVGALANLQAAHLRFDRAEDYATVQDFWQAPNLVDRPGHKAVDLFAAIGRGEIRAVWIMATNPLVSLPDSNAVRAALAGCPLVIVSEVEDQTETAPYAQIRLPALAWGEKDGTITNSERRISRQRAFLAAPGEARADWWIMTEVARRLGFAAAFPYTRPAEIFREHAALSAFRNNGERIFNLGGLQALTDAEYSGLSPVQWPVLAPQAGTERIPFPLRGFPTASGKARMVAVADTPSAQASKEHPLRLNTGRVRDQWHTMTRTARSPRLNAHTPEPTVTVHPHDALTLDLKDQGIARLTSRHGETLARIAVSEETLVGSVFLPMHWSAPFGTAARANALVGTAVDPLSGQPGLKSAAVRLSAAPMPWYGFLYTRDSPADPSFAYWIRTECDSCWRLEFAGEEPALGFEAWLHTLCGQEGKDEWLLFADPATRTERHALFRNRRLTAALFVGARPLLPPRAFVAKLFAEESVGERTRLALLSGRPPQGEVDPGGTICSCHQVGELVIRRAIMSGCRTVADLGRATQAGNNCGACIPELKRLLTRQTEKA